MPLPYSAMIPEMAAPPLTASPPVSTAPGRYPQGTFSAPDFASQHDLPPQAPIKQGHGDLQPTSSIPVEREQADAQPPSPVPISESDNTDAIALRAAMGILQLQRQRAIADMQTLERQKNMALGDPEGFANALRSGTVKMRSRQGILPQDSQSTESGEDSEEDGDSEEHGGVSNATGPSTSSFGEIPAAQNVVRMPPINWAKYHIVGQSLDKLHEEQRRRPMEGSPRTDEDFRRERERQKETVIAASYDPFTDRLEKGEKRKRGKDAEGHRG